MWRAVWLVLWACGDPTGVPADAVSIDAAIDAAPNLNPIAEAGMDATRLIGSTFALDGSASSDPDGTIVRYAWSIDTQPSGSAATIAVADTATTSFAPDKLGTYVFALEVTDDDGATDRDEVTVVIEAGTFTVDAGPDQTISWFTDAQLAGSYVSDSGPGTAMWRVVSQPVNSSTFPTPSTSLTPKVFAPKVGSYLVELAVTTPAGTATDTVTITAIAPPPQMIDGDIVDIDPGVNAVQFVIASTNPSRLRLLQSAWPAPASELAIPLTVTPTAVAASEYFVSVLHDQRFVTMAWITSLSQQATYDLGVPLLDARHGSDTPRVYPAQAGPIILLDHVNGGQYAGAITPGPSRAREFPSSERPVYVLDIGPSGKLRRYDGHDPNTALVREWPYAAGAYPLGTDLWIAGPQKLVVSTGRVFRMSEDPMMDLTHIGVLGGDAPFEIVGAFEFYDFIVTLNNRITTPPELPETQVRFYDPTTLALEHVIPLPDLVVGGVAQRTTGRSITATSNPHHVCVIGSAGTSYALIIVPMP